MMKAKWLLMGLLFVLLISSSAVSAQYDKKWSITQLGSVLVFDRDTTYSEPFSLTATFFYNAGALGSIYDSEVDKLYMSNSVEIVSDKKDTIANTYQFVDPPFLQQFPAGPPADDFTLLLPKRGSEYYAITRSGLGILQDGNGSFSPHLTYANVFDIKQGKMGEVVSYRSSLKDNHTVVATSLFAATRHGNGRDFWIIEKAKSVNTYFIYRTSPDTVVLDHIQTIGDSTLNGDAYGQGTFSPDGSMFAFTNITQYPQLFDFDRCTGLLSHPRKYPFPWYQKDGVLLPPVLPSGQLIGQVAVFFSPSSRYLYVNNYWRVYQYDLQVGDSAAVMQSGVLLAVWDSTWITRWGSTRPFFSPKIGPNGKIYYGTFDVSPDKISVIHSPDSPGLSCRLEVFGQSLNSRGNSPLPNVPNYSLGAKIGSGCDTAFTTGIRVVESLPWSMYPNPTATTLTIDLSGAATISILDLMGRAVLQQDIQDKTTLSLGHLSAGVYEVQLQQGERRGVKKLILMR